MSWSYSLALVGEYSDRSCSATELCALSNMTPMPDQFYWPDKTTEHSRLSRFGMTCVPLTESLGEELLMLFQADSLAKTLALQDQGPDWTARGLGYGEKWLGLLGKYDPVSCSLKTAQCSLFGDLTESFQTLPRWGLMLDGELFPQPMLELCTSANESGFLPTPVSIDSGSGRFNTSIGSSNKRPTLAMMAKRNLWPTPTVCGNYNRPGASKTSGMGLASAVRMFPTATATAYKGWSPNHNRANSDDRIDYTIEREAFESGTTGRLNPEWVEWLMGWPIGHTDLKQLETGRFQEFVRQHGNCFTGIEDAA